MLLETIDQKIITAMKAKDEVTLSTLRLLKSAVKNKQIELGGTISDEQILTIITQEIKKRKETIDLYVSGSRPEKIPETEKEITVLQEFLPPPLTTEELHTVITESIASLPETDRNNKGLIIKAVKEKVGFRAEARVVAEAISKVLA